MISCVRITVASLVASGLLVACAGNGAAADPPRLDDTAWVLSDLPGRTLAAGSRVTLRFEGGGATGSDGCNRYGLGYEAAGETIRIASSAGISTQMACPPEIMQQAEAFRAALGAASHFRIDGGNLQFLRDGAVVATLAPQSQVLADTKWEVTGYNNGRQAVVSVLNGTRLSIGFSADGKASGFAGCNRFSGTFESQGTSLSFGPVATTRMACASPDGVMEQEQAFLKALETVSTARFEGDRLELRTRDGALAMTLGRSPGE